MKSLCHLILFCSLGGLTAQADGAGVTDSGHRRRDMGTVLGIERLIDEYPELVRGNRTGVVTNYTMTDSRLIPVIDRLIRAFGRDIVKLFGPEHGVMAAAVEGESVGARMDEHSNLPALSLYGHQHQPTPEMMDDIDLIIVDLQDIGSRYFTYLSTLKGVLEISRDQGVRCIVVDRPNPIGGERQEGIPVQPQYTSFVGCLPIPARHGLTLGEMARWLQRTRYPTLELEVVHMGNWRRSFYWDETALPFVPPSPNTTGPDMMVLYPGTCLFEGVNVSVGRGTAKPFEIIGAPFIDGFRLARLFNRQNWPGVRARGLYFVPWRQRYAQTLCQGVQLHVTQNRILSPVRIGIALLQLIHELYPEHFSFGPSRSQGHADSLFFDLLAGSGELRKAIEAGAGQDFLADESSWLQDFREEITQDLLYT
ncbi:MAG: DUF1343 domain-containing protein [Sulfobacillus benefaciens]|uniref:DUF1343 domain-containing protein n=1 Tax=Sulfobacillus benefaciens TaxID=453960 RepID=A0A2T2X6F0_9FIRM|nr:MAG: DUF1343 domain-containing protein [Sulfobacillus benefaciens]